MVIVRKRPCTSCRADGVCRHCWDRIDTDTKPCTFCKNTKVCWRCKGSGKITHTDTVVDDIPF